MLSIDGIPRTGSADQLVSAVEDWWQRVTSFREELVEGGADPTHFGPLPRIAQVWVKSSSLAGDTTDVLQQLHQNHELSLLVQCPSLLSERGIPKPKKIADFEATYNPVGSDAPQVIWRTIREYSGSCTEVHDVFATVSLSDLSLDEKAEKFRIGVLEALQNCHCSDAEIENLEYFVLRFSSLEVDRAFEIPLTETKLDELRNLPRDTPVDHLLDTWSKEVLEQAKP